MRKILKHAYEYTDIILRACAYFKKRVQPGLGETVPPALKGGKQVTAGGAKDLTKTITDCSRGRPDLNQYRRRPREP